MLDDNKYLACLKAGDAKEDSVGVAVSAPAPATSSPQFGEEALGAGALAY
jgi:hypothetical protein